MHSDNIEVIIYKILKYVYECQRKGLRPKAHDIMPGSSELFDIPLSYWRDIMHIIEEEQLMEGVTVFPESHWSEVLRFSLNREDDTFCQPSEGSDEIVALQPPFRITLKGFTFLEENSMMARAKEFLGMDFEKELKHMLARL